MWGWGPSPCCWPFIFCLLFVFIWSWFFVFITSYWGLWADPVRWSRRQPSAAAWFREDFFTWNNTFLYFCNLKQTILIFLGKIFNLFIFWKIWYRLFLKILPPRFPRNIGLSVRAQCKLYNNSHGTVGPALQRALQQQEDPATMTDIEALKIRKAITKLVYGNILSLTN